MTILICSDFIAGDLLKDYSKNMFCGLLETIERADVRIFNQEHPVTRTSETYPVKKYGTTDACAPDCLAPIIDAGFNYVTLATNHMLDRGATGIRDTITFFKEHGIKTMGAGIDIREAQKTVYCDHGGESVAFVNLAENEYCSATSTHAGTHPVEIISNVETIREAKANANIVILILHGGLEYCYYPTPRQVRQSRFYVDCGASAIIWHHSHYVSGHEVYRGAPIYYGIGNFVAAKKVHKFESDSLARQSLSLELEVVGGRISCHGEHLAKFELESGHIEKLCGVELIALQERTVKVANALVDLAKLERIFAEELLTDDCLAEYMMHLTRSSKVLKRIAQKFHVNSIWAKYMKQRMKMSRANTALWNLVRCETHRDVLQMIYDHHIDVYCNNSISKG